MSTALADHLTASAPSPLVSIDLASTIERLGDAWPPGLVRPSDLAAAGAFARSLPPAFHWLMLETRLSPAHDERVDLLASIVDGPDVRSRVASLTVPAAPLIASWARREAPLLGDAHVLWLEWDAPFDRAPLQIGSLDPRFWGPRSARPAALHQVALCDALHRASFGRSHDARVLDRLATALAALPRTGTALFGANLAPRGRRCDRLFVALPRAQVLAWLRAVGWPGDEARAARWLGRAVTTWETAYVQIELTAEGPTPYLAIESRQTTGSRSERRARSELLEWLVASGRVPRERARAALAWEGRRRVNGSEEVRSIHLKCAWNGSEEVEVKAYLGVCYLPASAAS